MMSRERCSSASITEGKMGSETAAGSVGRMGAQCAQAEIRRCHGNHEIRAAGIGSEWNRGLNAGREVLMGNIMNFYRHVLGGGRVHCNCKEIVGLDGRPQVHAGKKEQFHVAPPLPLEEERTWLPCWWTGGNVN